MSQPPPQGSLTGAETLRIGFWFALLGGIVEFSVRQLEFHGFGRAIHQGWSSVWMIPLNNTVVFTLAGLLLIAAARWMPAVGRPGVAVVVFAAFAGCGVTLLLPRIHLASQIVLGIGMAVGLSRLPWFRTPRPFRLILRTLPALALAVAVLGIGYEVAWRVSERRALSRLPAGRTEAPNVLLLLLDTVRAYSLSVYGYELPTTPRLTELARRGVVFERAMASSPWTLPSHATMFTGHHPQETSAGFVTPLDGAHPTLAEALRDDGYATAGFVANIAYTSREHGLARGFVHYSDFHVSFVTLVKSSAWGRLIHSTGALDPVYDFLGARGRKYVSKINDDFLAWLPKRGDRPFFAFLNYYNAHFRYVAPPPFDTMFVDQSLPDYGPDEADDFRMHSPAQRKRANQSYDGAIAYTDHEIGALLAELDRRGVLENTIVVVASDHGEQFGEHNKLWHGNSLYRQVIQVPLIVLWPRGNLVPGRIATPVGYRDFPATILDLTGVPNARGIPGEPLTRMLRGSPDSLAAANYRVLAAYSPDRDLRPASYSYSVMAEGEHYIRWLTGGLGTTVVEELYALDGDPLEEKDLAQTAEGAARLPRFRALLDSLVGRPVAEPGAAGPR